MKFGFLNKYLIILFSLMFTSAEITFCQNINRDSIQIPVKALLGGGYYCSTYNNIKGWGVTFNYGVGSNFGLIIDAGSLIDVLFIYSHFGFQAGATTSGSNVTLSSDNYSINMKFKFGEQTFKPYLIVGLTENEYSGSRYYIDILYDKRFEQSYLTEDLGTGVCYKLSKTIELDGNVKLGFLISEFEIDRIMFNLGITMNLFDL